MFQAIILGAIQGLTEFLPISSSGHLVLVHYFLGFSTIDPAFDVFVQGGTVLSLLVYFTPKLEKLYLTIPYMWQLFLGMLPAAVAGILLKDQIEAMFGTLSGISLGFFLTTTFLLLTKYLKKNDSVLTSSKSLLIGLSQAASIFPSLSRSGATISTALMLGVKPNEAFNYSFLMSIPLVAGASLLSAKEMVWNAELTPIYLVGFAIAAVVGYFTLILLDKIVLRGKFYLFAPYTLALAILTLFLN